MMAGTGNDEARKQEFIRLYNGLKKLRGEEIQSDILGSAACTNGVLAIYFLVCAAGYVAEGVWFYSSSEWSPAVIEVMLGEVPLFFGMGFLMNRLISKGNEYAKIGEYWIKPLTKEYKEELDKMVQHLKQNYTLDIVQEWEEFRETLSKDSLKEIPIEKVRLVVEEKELSGSSNGEVYLFLRYLDKKLPGEKAEFSKGSDEKKDEHSSSRWNFFKNALGFWGNKPSSSPQDGLEATV